MHFRNTYDHQTWQAGNLRWGNPTFKVTSPFDYVVTCHMKKNYICTSAIPMFTRLGRVVTCRAGPQIQSQVIFLLWGHVTHEKNFYLHFHNTYGHQTWQTGNLRWGNPTFKVTSPFDYVVTCHMKKNYICTSAIPMFTKLGRVVTCRGGTPNSKSSYLFVMGSRDT